MKSRICGLIFFLMGILSGCHQNRSVVQREDYLRYLRFAKTTTETSENISFWMKRLALDGDDEVALLKLAGLFAESFRTTGEASYIRMSDSLYVSAVNNGSDPASIYQMLSVNGIAQHKFKQAEDFAHKALAIGDHQAASKLILADVVMERGFYDWASKLLGEFTNKNSFAWLIRKAKLEDHYGNGEAAIELMERAYERIKGNKTLACWTLSNLADMYGHHGRIEDAYKNYRKVLAEDPQHDHALQGIAWIALSHDRKEEVAAEIVHSLIRRKRMPEAHLMLAECAVLRGDSREQSHQLKLFRKMVDNPTYQTMYNKYIALIEADYFNNPARCISIAEEEIENRPCPQSYDLLAWGYFKSGDVNLALQVVDEFLIGQTFEPLSIFHMGMIYLAAGKVRKGRAMLEHALQSSFELGPSVTKKIQWTLASRS